MIKGAGVDLKKFYFSKPTIKDKISIILPARLLWDKGVNEFHDASLILREKYRGKIEFKLIGMADIDNNAGVGEDEVQEWIEKGYFSRINYQIDMVPIYTKSDIVVLPSYREGMPKTLLEACSVGRPIVTTNAIGCRECVDEGVNGFKVPVKSAMDLANAIEKLIINEPLRVKMGIASRLKAEREFDEKNVILKHLEIYKSLLNE